MEPQTTIVVPVIVEIERHSNMKMEMNKATGELELDRILAFPYFYPYAYGYIPNTMGNDGDELDILYITDRRVENYDTLRTEHTGCIVGGLVMEDEKGMDEKIFVVPVDEYAGWHAMDESVKQRTYNDIAWFFGNYKNGDSDRWSRVSHFLSESEAVILYKECRQLHENRKC